MRLLSISTVFVIAFILGACASTPVTMESADKVDPSRIAQPELMVKKPGTVPVIVSRDNAFAGVYGFAPTYNFKINGKQVAGFRTGERIVLYLPKGKYIFGVFLTITGDSKELTVEIGGSLPDKFRMGLSGAGTILFNRTAL